MRLCPSGLVEFANSSIVIDHASKNGEPVIISHAHSDHAVKSGNLFATQETSRLLEARYGVRNCYKLRYGEAMSFNGTRVTLYPAGHILGSAQILIEGSNTSLLYSGDIKLREPRSCAPIRVPEAENLILEATFGTHLYQWPPRDRIEKMIFDFINNTMEKGKTPVFTAYSLGKSQELLAILAKMGVEVSVTKTIYELSKIYEEFGVNLGSYTLYEDEPRVPGVLIIPPQKARYLKLKGYRIAMVSGWAMTERRRSVTPIPLSDHADFGELLRYVDKVKPKKVWTTHGYAHELATALRHRGYDADVLHEQDESRQIEILAD